MSTFVVVDLETTGLDPGVEAILEVAAVRIVDGAIAATFQSLVKPPDGVAIGEGSFAVHGISAEMVADAPAIGEVLPGFLAFLGDAALVAHNAPFDLAFLNRALAAEGLPALPNAVHDSLEMAREVFPEQRSHKLESLCKLLGHPAAGFHRAAEDAGHLAAVFPRLLALWEQKRAWYRAQFAQIDHLARRWDQVNRLVEALQVEAGDLRRVLALYFADHPDARIPLPGGEALVQSTKETFDYDLEALGPLLDELGIRDRLTKLDRQRLERWMAAGRFDEAALARIQAARTTQGTSQRIARAAAVTPPAAGMPYAGEREARP